VYYQPYSTPKPADTEALLAVQMATVHNAMMVAARRLSHVEGSGQQDSASTMFNKLARTFAAQVEALKRYRLKGEQIIKVQHVTINDGGRAIVGDVQHAPGGSLKSERQSHELATSNAPGPALLGNVQTNGQSMPSPGVKFGKPISEADVAPWNIDVRTSDGKGLPAGRVSAALQYVAARHRTRHASLVPRTWRERDGLLALDEGAALRPHDQGARQRTHSAGGQGRL
jgi:hypothetical protein